VLFKVDEIICYIDLTDQSTKVLRCAMDIALRYYANLTVIHIMEQPKKSLVDALERTISKEQLVEISNRMAEDCHREFNNFCKREKNELVDVSVEMKSVFLSEGISHEEIIAQAKQKNADLIIMGKNNNYSNNYGQKLIGNTTLGVLLGSDIPILCI